MDPKQNSNQPLDPKLQAVYDKVMGTPTDTGATPPTPSAVTPEPTPASPAMPANPVPEPSMPNPAPAQPENPQPVEQLPGSPLDAPTPPMPANPAEPNPMGDTSIPVPSVEDNPATPPTMPGEITSPATPGGDNAMTIPGPTPTEPTQPAAPEPAQTPTPEPTPTPPTDDSQPSEAAPQPDVPAMENMQAAMSHVVPHETVKIGMGGSPVAAAKAKGKGISPVILIFGAFAFLVVYAVFWVRFFGYSIPFITQ